MPDLDTLVLTLLDSLRVCLCDKLEAAGAPVCRCAVYAGAYAAADACSCDGGNCGQAWVRLDRVYPTERFPSSSTSVGNCGNTLAAVIEVGVYRCRPKPTRSGMPSAADVTESALGEARDAALMAQAIACCETLTRRPYVLGSWSPRDSGDCGGGAWTVTVQLVHVPGDPT